MVLAAALRSRALSLAKNCSIGFEVGAVGGQVTQFGAGGFDGLANASNLVAGEIVHHHNIAWPQDRDDDC